MRLRRTSLVDFFDGDDRSHDGGTPRHDGSSQEGWWPWCYAVVLCLCVGRRRPRHRCVALSRLGRHALAKPPSSPRHAPGKPPAMPPPCSGHAPAMPPAASSVRSVGPSFNRTGPADFRSCFEGPDRPIFLSGQDRASPDRAGHEPVQKTARAVHPE